MNMAEIKAQIRTWMNSIGPKAATIGDLMLFAFTEVVPGKNIQKAVSALAKEGFLCYVDSKLTHPDTGKPIPYFRKRN